MRYLAFLVFELQAGPSVTPLNERTVLMFQSGENRVKSAANRKEGSVYYFCTSKNKFYIRTMNISDS